MENIIDCKSILTQKYPTGHDVGLLLFASLINTMEERKSNKPFKLQYTQRQFDKAVSRLDEQQRIIYEPYRVLYKSIIAAFNQRGRESTYFYSTMMNIASELRHLNNENAMQLINYATPLIVTESEYNTLYKQTAERLQREGKPTEKITRQDIANTLKGDQETPESYYRYFRALTGFALISKVIIDEADIDDNGNYKDPSLWWSTFNNYATLTKGKYIYSQQLKKIREYGAYNYAFTVLLGILEHEYKIPRLQEKLSPSFYTTNFEGTVSDYNTKLQECIKGMAGSDSLIAQKTKALQDTLPAINIEKLKPSLEQVHDVKQLIHNIGYGENVSLYVNLQTFIDRLMPKVE